MRWLARAGLLAVAVPAGVWLGAQLARVAPDAEPDHSREPAWRSIGRSASAELWLDTASLERDAEIRRVTERQELAEPDPDGVRSRRYRNEYDCQSRRHRIGAVSSYAGPALGGKRLFVVDERGYWREVPPGSLFERAFEAVCADHPAARVTGQSMHR